MNSIETLAVGACYVDINVPRFPFGREGIPSETELVGGDYETVAGGSAVNFCRLLQELGVATGFMGMTGEDVNGELLNSLLHSAGVESELIRRADLSTNVSFNVTSPDGEHILLVAGTANAALNPEAVIPKMEAVLPHTKKLYLGGCFKLTSLIAAYSQITDIADRTTTELVVDHGRIPKGTSSETLEAIKELVLRTRYYLPSHNEFCQLWEAASIEQGLRLLHERKPSLTVVVKDGANGAYHLSSGYLRHTPAPRVSEVVNATGAGDSFNAGLIAAIVDGRPLAASVVYACMVAAAKVSGQGIPLLK
jgi:ribokinase